MIRATPVEMRKALEIVEVLRRAGVRFVPVPVRTEQEYSQLTEQALQRLEDAAQEAESAEDDRHER